MAKRKQSFLRWLVTQRKISALLKERDYRRAMVAADFFLKTRPAPLERGDALAMRSSLWEDLGNLRKAGRDMAEACRLSKPASFSRYTRQVALGTIGRKSQSFEEALEWHRKALRTSLAAGNINSGAALRRFLAIRKETTLTAVEKDLCWRNVRQSWRILGLKGNPNSQTLKSALGKIRRQEEAAHRRAIREINKSQSH